jgi:glycine dehydrogenase
VSDASAFQHRHIGPDRDAQDDMLRAVGVPSIDALIDQTIPSGIRFSKGLTLPPAETEAAYLRRLRTVAAKNRVARSYIGMGYYDCATPAVILRNVFENPGWYTPYTPYQAEIAQGRLESLLNFQTVVRDLTGMEIASASLLDEGTAAAEAMTMFHRLNTKKAPAGQPAVFLVSGRTFPQTIDVLKGRAAPLGIELQIGDPDSLPMNKAFGLLLQYPDDHGEVRDLTATVENTRRELVEGLAAVRALVQADQAQAAARSKSSAAGKDFEDAVAEIVDQAGWQFDPSVVQAFQEREEALRRVYYEFNTN